MTNRDDPPTPPDSLGGKLHELFEDDDETSSDDTTSDDSDLVDPLPKRPTDPPF
ncbi:MAG TPA: hypothetical protein VFM03_01835 [Candidatus Limnocylindria bacterium]|jgi:hypothetical protein|nr:hypothetical protein [Candidatus Limnocylindria bacterium]